MRRIPDILNTSLKSFKKSCFSKSSISKSVHSHSNNNLVPFDCQLNQKQIDNYNEFLLDNLTKSQFKVFKAFMELHLKHNGNLHPSLDLIASMAQCARSTVQLAIKKLQGLNIIKTEYRGYRQTLVYQIHEFYVENRSKIASLVKNVAMVAMLLLSSPVALLGNRYLLKEKDVYFRLINEMEVGRMTFQFTKEQYVEMRKYPQWVHDRTMAIFNRKMAEGIPIANHSGYFMGIFKQEAGKSQAVEPSTNSRQYKSNPKTGTHKPFIRPSDGPYSLYVPEPKRSIESDFDISTKLEMVFHTNPNSFSKVVADMNLQKLTNEDKNAIMMVVHKDCKCRPELQINVLDTDNLIAK